MWGPEAMQAAEIDYHMAVAMLGWQYDLGVTEAMGDVPVNRYALAEAAPLSPRPDAAVRPMGQSTAAPRTQGASAMGDESVSAVVRPDPMAAARRLAGQAASLEDLRAAIETFDLCELKRGAKSTVFAAGNPGARVMVIGEAPDRDEDAGGQPFMGRSGQLLDRMFAAIGMGRESPDPDLGIYLVNVIPWRTPQSRAPTSDELALMRPFMERHVELAAPDLIILMGDAPCEAVLDCRGITRMRGGWATGLGRPVLPMLHPAHLLRHPTAKREAWADLLTLQARLRAGA